MTFMYKNVFDFFGNPNRPAASYTGKELSDRFGFATSRDEINKIFQDAIDQGLAVGKDTYDLASSRFYENIAAQYEALQRQLMQNNAQAVNTGASQGVAAANQLSLLLGASQQGMDAATYVLDEGYTLAKQSYADKVAAEKESLDYYNNLMNMVMQGAGVFDNNDAMKLAATLPYAMGDNSYSSGGYTSSGGGSGDSSYGYTVGSGDKSFAVTGPYTDAAVKMFGENLTDELKAQAQQLDIQFKTNDYATDVLGVNKKLDNSELTTEQWDTNSNMMKVLMDEFEYIHQYGQPTEKGGWAFSDNPINKEPLPNGALATSFNTQGTRYRSAVEEAAVNKFTQYALQNGSKKDANGNVVVTPKLINDYTKNMTHADKTLVSHIAKTKGLTKQGLLGETFAGDNALDVNGNITKKKLQDAQAVVTNPNSMFNNQGYIGFEGKPKAQLKPVTAELPTNPFLHKTLQRPGVPAMLPTPTPTPNIFAEDEEDKKKKNKTQPSPQLPLQSLNINNANSKFGQAQKDNFKKMQDNAAKEAAEKKIRDDQMRKSLEAARLRNEQNALAAQNAAAAKYAAQLKAQQAVAQAAAQLKAQQAAQQHQQNNVVVNKPYVPNPKPPVHNVITNQFPEKPTLPGGNKPWKPNNKFW